MTARNRSTIIFVILSAVFIWFGGKVLTGIFLRSARISPGGIVQDIVFAFSIVSVTIVLLGLRNVFFLFRDRRNRVPGVRIRTRLTVSFLLVTFIPVVILGGVIAFIMSTGLKAVYRPEVEAVLSRTVMMFRDQRKRERNRLLVQARRIISGRPGFFFVRNSKSNGGLLFVGRAAADALPRTGLSENALQLLKRKSGGPALTPIDHRGRIAYLFFRPLPGYVEFALVDPGGEAGATAAQVASSLSKYRQLRVLRDPLAAAFVYLTLFALVLSTLFVFLVSLRISRSLTAPLKDLGIATRRVAQGDLEYRVDYPRHDAIGFLVDNFNRMTDELSRSRTKLYNAERIAAWQEVARRLAHEIKNPLTPIRLVAERILRQSNKEGVEILPLVKNALPTILSEVHVIQELVDEFSAFAKLPSIHLKSMDADRFFSEVVSSYNDEAGVRIEYIPAGCPVFLSIDAAQMRRVCSNLFQNSLRAVKGKSDAQITLQIRCTGDNARIAVRDNGHGIPEEIRENIFQPYFTASDGGTGLGLAIVQKIIVEHRGSIWFRSVHGEGTTFYIELPLSEQEGDGIENRIDS